MRALKPRARYAANCGIDGGEDADDRHDHEQLDQRETLRLLTLHLGNLAHAVLPWLG